MKRRAPLHGPGRPRTLATIASPASPPAAACGDAAAIAAVRSASAPATPLPNPLLDDIKKTLWATADKLRANMDAAEYKHLVLGLIFIKYISDTFTARTAELAARLRDPDDEYFYGDASDEDIAAELTRRIQFGQP